MPPPAGGPAYADLDRPPLSERQLSAAVTRTPPWRALRVLPEISSTNDLAATAARGGEPEGLVVVAELQTGGRGRLDRQWVSPARAGLTFSMLFRPDVPSTQRPWLPLLVALSVARAVRDRTDVDVALKWPNDLLAGGAKVGGMLAEVAGDAVVVGVGINVSNRPDELPRADASSLALAAGRPVDRAPLLLAVLRAVGPAYAGWVAAGGDSRALREEYRVYCETLGRPVLVSLPGGAELAGQAVDVDEAGRLVVRAHDGTETAVSAGDVVHVRPS